MKYLCACMSAWKIIQQVPDADWSLARFEEDGENGLWWRIQDQRELDVSLRGHEECDVTKQIRSIKPNMIYTSIHRFLLQILKKARLNTLNKKIVGYTPKSPLILGVTGDCPIISVHLNVT